jgi:hypothetical protein
MKITLLNSGTARYALPTLKCKLAEASLHLLRAITVAHTNSTNIGEVSVAKTLKYYLVLHSTRQEVTRHARMQW